MKKKLAICLCMTILALTACGKVSNERVTTSQDDMTKEEAIEYAQQLFAENVGDAEDMDSLLNNMIADATDDFMGSGTSDLVKEENENVSASSDIQKEEDLQINVEKESTELYLEPTNTILAEIPEGYEKVDILVDKAKISIFLAKKMPQDKSLYRHERKNNKNRKQNKLSDIIE